MAKKKARASNGMGSVRQRSDGRWEARYTAPDGKQKSVYGKTQKDVTAKLRGVLHDIDAGSWQEPSKMTVSDWFEIWLTDYQGHNTERTVNKYRSIVNTHFIPMLGNMKLSKLLPLHIRQTINKLNDKGLQPVTLKNYIRILGASMQCAIEAGLIKENPVDNAKVPRVPPTQLHIIEVSDIPAFTAAAEDTPYPNELKLMLYTGLRIGELRGLQWGDCDLDVPAPTIHVQRQLHPVNHSNKRFSPPKYGEDRTIYITDDAVKVLRDQRKRQAAQRLASGQWQDTDITKDLVFRQPNGSPHTGTSLNKVTKQVGEAIGQPALHPHDLRHSYAVISLRSGVDVKTVQYNMGHKTSQMTLDVYAAYTESAGKEGATKLSDYLKNGQN